MKGVEGESKKRKQKEQQVHKLKEKDSRATKRKCGYS